MKLDAAAMRFLHDKGLSTLDIIAFMELPQDRADPTAAERQQRRRDKLKEHRDASHRDVTRDPPNDKSSNPLPVSETKVSSTKRRVAKISYFEVRPVGVDPKHWADFVANRRRKRLPDSETAYLGQLDAIAEIADEEWPPGRLVQHAAAKGWGSINDPRKPLNGNGNDNGNRQSNPNGIGRTTAAAISVIDRLNRGSAERSEVPRISHAR